MANTQDPWQFFDPGGNLLPDTDEWVVKFREAHASERLATAKREQDLQSQVHAYRDWQQSITVALGRAGGAFYSDVPIHIRQLRKELATGKRLLAELHALVRGECPSLLNEDSGGDARLALAITSYLLPQVEEGQKE